MNIKHYSGLGYKGYYIAFYRKRETNSLNQKLI